MAHDTVSAETVAAPRHHRIGKQLSAAKEIRDAVVAHLSRQGRLDTQKKYIQTSRRMKKNNYHIGHCAGLRRPATTAGTLPSFSVMSRSVTGMAAGASAAGAPLRQNGGRLICIKLVLHTRLLVGSPADEPPFPALLKRRCQFIFLSTQFGRPAYQIFLKINS